MLHFNNNIGISHTGIGSTGSNAGSADLMVDIFASNKPLFAKNSSIFSQDSKNQKRIMDLNYTKPNSLNNSFVKVPKNGIFGF